MQTPSEDQGVLGNLYLQSCLPPTTKQEAPLKKQSLYPSVGSCCRAHWRRCSVIAELHVTVELHKMSWVVLQCVLFLLMLVPTVYSLLHEVAQRSLVSSSQFKEYMTWRGTMRKNPDYGPVIVDKLSHQGNLFANNDFSTLVICICAICYGAALPKCLSMLLRWHTGKSREDSIAKLEKRWINVTGVLYRKKFPNTPPLCFIYESLRL